jgi:arylsulfatase A-like enzyme
MGQYGVIKDKRLPYECDLHLPAFVRGPGIVPGTVVNDVILNIDFFPTFMDIAGDILLHLTLL